MRETTHQTDLCVVGGGLSGLCAAVAAARHGTKVVLLQDRPMLGGNASSEVRMWICGAHGDNNRETGIIEEIELENLYRNPYPSFSIWDSVILETAMLEPNITLLLNCACSALGMDGDRIAWVKGYQSTAETWHTVQAKLFADCSGDSVLAPLCGADFRVGREARTEHDEDIEPEVGDRRTMGMSCLIQARETDRPQPYTPPKWAHVYASESDLPNRPHDLHKTNTNYWWLELGGEDDSIHDTETLRDELLRTAFGLWDHIKNHGDHGADNWTLEWVGFLPGKRESRRYLGDHIVTQNDVRAEGRFDDLVAYGGWTMDDHHPAGFRYPGQPTIFHPAPSPFGLPYRALYSRNITNLFFAGRNISCTHAAMSATRVMATCALCGQAVGTAAAIATHDGLTPRVVYELRRAGLQQLLMDDDCYLPWHTRAVPEISQRARLTASAGNPEPLRNGLDRPIGGEDNGWAVAPGGWVEYHWEQSQPLTLARIVFDSDLNRTLKNMPCSFPLHAPLRSTPATMTRAFRLEALDTDGQWRVVAHVEDNHQRLVRLPLEVTTRAIRLVPETTWGAERAHLYAFDVR
jgi:hypothetical protein